MPDPACTGPVAELSSSLDGVGHEGVQRFSLKGGPPSPAAAATAAPAASVSSPSFLSRRLPSIASPPASN